MPSSRLFYFPILQLFAALHGEIRPVQLREKVAALLGLTPQIQQKRYRSGQFILASRIYYALSKLNHHGLVNRVRRGVYSCTPLGNALLQAHPRGFNPLLQKRIGSKKPWEPEALPPLPPILLHLYQLTPTAFEHAVLGLLKRLGYGKDGQVIHLGGPGDQGVDGEIWLDPLGLLKIYMQAKRYAPDRFVGGPEMQAFFGALAEKGCDKGLFVTTSCFSSAARAFAEKIPGNLTLLDGPQLAEKWAGACSSIEIATKNTENSKS